MNVTELCQLVGADKIGVQNVLESITNAKQKRGYVEISMGTDCISLRELATGEFDNVVLLVSISKEDHAAAVAAHAANQARKGE